MLHKRDILFLKTFVNDCEAERHVQRHYFNIILKDCHFIASAAANAFNATRFSISFRIQVIRLTKLLLLQKAEKGWFLRHRHIF